MTPGVLNQPAALRSRLARLPIYYGWVQVLIAAIAMTATLPGRTYGLGLIEEPLTTELGIQDVLFGRLNFWAVIIGSALCLPIGRLIDRIGCRATLAGVVFLLGIAVLAMSSVAGIAALFVLLTLVRGLGQGALSVVSLALIGKWFTRRLGPAMGVFTVLLAFGFIGSGLSVGNAVQSVGWRNAWAGLGWFLIAFAPVAWLLTRSMPETVGLSPDRSARPEDAGRPAPLDLPLASALRSPAFWAFTLGACLFNAVLSAVTLFNAKLLNSHQFPKEMYTLVLIVLTVSGLPVNLLAGWAARYWPLGRLLAIGMILLAISLAIFPYVATVNAAILYAALLGGAGGIITVVFFAVYGHTFGRSHLGKIQAVVQVVSVFASAIGPVLLTEVKDVTGSFDLFFLVGAPLALVLGLAAWLARLPQRPTAAA